MPLAMVVVPVPAICPPLQEKLLVVSRFPLPTIEPLRSAKFGAETFVLSDSVAPATLYVPVPLLNAAPALSWCVPAAKSMNDDDCASKRPACETPAVFSRLMTPPPDEVRVPPDCRFRGAVTLSVPATVCWKMPVTLNDPAARLPSVPLVATLKPPASETGAPLWKMMALAPLFQLKLPPELMTSGRVS